MTSFTKSIDSNLKLLRVILLTKGSSIMEFGLLLEKGEDLLDEENSEFMQAVQKKKQVALIRKSYQSSKLGTLGRVYLFDVSQRLTNLLAQAGEHGA